MGNMGQQDLGNATSATSLLHELRDLWKSPRGSVLRIEALALVAIFLSFFLAFFGSCRRWSNHWFFQKGFLVANAVFLSLGTYSIGLMQSSRVKSEMYPIWAVSLLALLCCVDSAAASGLDNKSQIWIMLYQLCLYFGYVLLMSITTISSDIDNIAVCVLAAVTFIKGFHRSMALVLPGSMRNMIRDISAHVIRRCSFGDPDGHEERQLIVDGKIDIMDGDRPVVSMGVIASMRCDEGNTRMVQSDIDACKDVCLSLSLSHLLHRRFLGLSSVQEQITTTSTGPLVKNYKRAFKVVEMELAFLYDTLYTSNTFLYYYEAKSASIWAFASVLGICFIGAVVAIIVPSSSARARMKMNNGGDGHATAASPSPDAGTSSTIFVDTTTADFVITGVILVSLSLLQVLQLLRCWTSNWARVAFACDWVRKIILDRSNDWMAWISHSSRNEAFTIGAKHVSWGMRLRASLIKISSWPGRDYEYLWQNKIGQHSLIESVSVPGRYRQLFCRFRLECCRRFNNNHHNVLLFMLSKMCRRCRLLVVRIVRKCWEVLGLPYISRVLQETLLLGSSNSNTWSWWGESETTVELHPDVKASIGDFVMSDKIRGHQVNGWASPTVENGQQGGDLFPDFLSWEMFRLSGDVFEQEIFVPCILMWHIATCYCELAQKHGGGGGDSDDKHQQQQQQEITKKYDDRRVATALSKYCAYLVVSAPRLLPGQTDFIKMLYAEVREEAIWSQINNNSPAAAADRDSKLLAAMENYNSHHLRNPTPYGSVIFESGRNLGKALHTKLSAARRWELLAEFWVKALVYAAPSDNTEEHMQHLSQGGELITHLWAMLYHAGIHKWQLSSPPTHDDFKMGWDYIFRIRSWKDLEQLQGKKTSYW